MYINHIFHIYLSVDEHLGWFHVLAVVIMTAINMGVCLCGMFSWISGYTLSIVWSDCSSVSGLMSCYDGFHSDWASLHFKQQCKSSSFLRFSPAMFLVLFVVVVFKENSTSGLLSKFSSTELYPNPYCHFFLILK